VFPRHLMASPAWKQALITTYATLSA
jgi:hypothetical protein